MSELVTGDKVTYLSPSQWRIVGVIVRIGKGGNGGDCIVRWDRGDSEECLSNLRKAEVSK